MQQGGIRRGARIAALLIAALWLASLAPPARAARDMTMDYRATAFVTGNDLRYRAFGFGLCLRDVLVKLSGEPRLYRDPRVAKLMQHAARLIKSFYYIDPKAVIAHRDDQASYDRSHYLTVTFDRAAIDKALAGLGERPWRGRRPMVIPAISVRGVKGAYLLSAENPAAADQRASFALLASDYDLEVRIPSEAELASWGITMGWFPSPQIASTPAQVILVGWLEFDPAVPGWTGSWRTLWQGRAYAWSIRGVNYDAAFRDALKGVLRVVSGHGGPE